MGQFTKGVIRFFGDLLFPPRCAACDELLPPFLEDGSVFCADCGEEFDRCCREAYTHVRLAAQDGHAYLCAYRSGETNGVPERLVYHLKHKGERRVFRFVARRLSSGVRVALACAVEESPSMGDSDLSSNLPEGQTLSGLPRPLYTYPPRRRGAVCKDGFDQARRLSRALAQVGEGDFASLLSRRMDGREQKRLDTAGRLENAKATYRLRRGAAKCIKGRVIVLCDDLSTTGATLHAAAELLREAGARAVVLATVAQTPEIVTKHK